jgi:metallo-beta-lactamase class B
MRIALLILAPCLLCAQEQGGAPAKRDSPQVKAAIAKAKKIAGSEWAAEAHFLCEAPHPASPNDPLLEPTKLFDDLYLVGREGAEVYALTTQDGIILFDAGSPADVDSVVIPGLQKLGLDPAKIKFVIVSHGHADHVGGAAYLQEHYGAHVYVGAADWDLIEHPRAGRGKKGPAMPMPRHDMVAAEGQPIVLGGVTVTPIAIPGHTAGSMGFIFPVKEQGKTHMAGIFGGAILITRAARDADLEQYRNSIAHFKEIAQKMKVDVELKDSPLTDGEATKLEKLNSRENAQSNPFVVGQKNYEKFLDVMTACLDVQVDRRKD